MKFALRILIVISLFWLVYGFTIPNYDWYVTDKVGVFSQIQKEDLTAKIQEIEKATSIEIAILVVPTVDDDINLAAVDVGNKRWVGKKGQNNGLVLLIAVDDRKRSIQVGYGLEWILPDLATRVWKMQRLEDFVQKESIKIIEGGIHKKIIAKEKNRFLRQTNSEILSKPVINRNPTKGEYLEVEVMRPSKRVAQ